MKRYQEEAGSRDLDPSGPHGHLQPSLSEVDSGQHRSPIVDCIMGCRSLQERPAR